jgi:hypothetical protein
MTIPVVHVGSKTDVWLKSGRKNKIYENLVQIAGKKGTHITKQRQLRVIKQIGGWNAIDPFIFAKSKI